MSFAFCIVFLKQDRLLLFKDTLISICMALKSSGLQVGGFCLVLEYIIEGSVTPAMGHHVWFKNSSNTGIYCLTSVHLSPITPNALDTK